MRHRKDTFKINRHGGHRKSLLANMVCSLYKSGRIATTTVRAKVVRRLAEKMITLGKDGSLAARRRAIAALRQKDVVRLLFAEIAPRYAARPGGYTRIIHVGQRVGDAADMSFLELLPADAPAPAAAAPAAPAAPAEAAPANA
ncbi:MAG: 50S ribosomal protein L17 [Lentisphaeria bacterium]|jgi:large subunit ribosomal protein L17